MATGELADREIYLQVNNDIQNEIADIQEKITNIKRHSQDWLEQSSNLIYLAKKADELFLQGTDEEKQILINCVASNLYLKDKKVYFSLKKPFDILAKGTKSPVGLPLWGFIRTIPQ